MKTLLSLLFACTISAGFSQDIGFRSDAGIGTALTFGGLKSYGISASAEPKVLIGDNITAGMRIEGNVLFGGKITSNSSDLSVGMSLRAAYLGKGEYYFGDGDARFFTGLMMGMYTQATIGATGNADASISASRGFGFAPEVGVSLGNFRISGMYHFVPGKDLVHIGVGQTQEISRNYLVIQIGFRAFGFNDER